MRTLAFTSFFIAVICATKVNAQGTCTATIDQCSMCNAQNNCTQCMDTYGLTPADTCAACAEGATPQDDCTLCNTNANGCSLCAMATYGPVIGGDGSCAPCGAFCYGCLISGAGNCDPYMCAPGYGLNAAGKCLPCHEGCPSCVAAGAGKCNTCLIGYGRNSKPFDPDNLSLGCTACSALFCEYCFVNYQTCQVCLPGYNLDPLTLLCTPICAYVTRAEWGSAVAQPAGRPINAKYLPVRNIIIHQTFTETCDTFADCSWLVRNDQLQQMRQRKLKDIAYNFLIGGDGYIYEGRGVNISGDVTPKWDDRSYSVAFIGTFIKDYPNKAAQNAFRRLIRTDCIIPQYTNISPNFQIFTHYDVECSLCPGGHLRHWIENTMASRYGGSKIECNNNFYRTWLHAMK